MIRYREFHHRSVTDPEHFWREQAQRIHWETPFDKVLDDSNLPFAKWFIGGRTNLCYNALDRHLAERSEQPALVYVSTETGLERTYTYAELHAEINRMAAIMLTLGAKRGERVLIYMPMVAEALFAMLACARIGAIHSVVFGGFAANSLATRIDDAQPKVILSASCGLEPGRLVHYKPLLDDATALASTKPASLILHRT